VKVGDKMDSSGDQSEFDETEYYEQQGDHQKLKHQFIETYMKIWVENVGYNTKGNPPSIDFFDLYAASGCATNKDRSEYWPGSALILAKNFGEYPNSRMLFLNTYHENKEIEENQARILQKKVRDLEDCPHVYAKTVFCRKEISEATLFATELLNRAFPSVWILDPYDPLQLPWLTIHSISSAIGVYRNKKGERVERRPEIIITLFTSILQRFSEMRPDMIKIAFDMNEEEWKKRFAFYAKLWRSRGIEHPTRHVVLDIYLEKLSDYYTLPILVILVPGRAGQIVYAMIHCTNNRQGHYLMRKKLSEGFGGYIAYKWVKGAGLQQLLTGGQKTLDYQFQ
jgi:three-Cys-motif partner protein